MNIEKAKLISALVTKIERHNEMIEFFNHQYFDEYKMNYRGGYDVEMLVEDVKFLLDKHKKQKEEAEIELAKLS